MLQTNTHRSTLLLLLSLWRQASLIHTMGRHVFISLNSTYFSLLSCFFIYLFSSSTLHMLPSKKLKRSFLLSTKHILMFHCTETISNFILLSPGVKGEKKRIFKKCRVTEHQKARTQRFEHKRLL